MSDTPETDAAAQAICSVRSPQKPDGSCAGVSVVLADFARKLERERNEAQRIIEQQFQQIKELFQDESKLKTERDQLRKVADAMAKQYRYEMMSMFGHAADCDCSRCEPMTKLYKSLPHVIERNKSK